MSSWTGRSSAPTGAKSPPSASKARSSTCGTPARPTAMAATSRPSSPPAGFPLCVSPAEPGSVHDLTAARTHALLALYRAAATGLPALADPGYEGAGIGIHMPVKQPASGRELDIDTRTGNALRRSMRCLGEGGFALFTGRWRPLQHITASPGKIGDIARAALVLTHFEHGYIT